MSVSSTIPVLGGQVIQARQRGSAISQAVAVPNLDGAILGYFRPIVLGVSTTTISTASDPKGAGRAVTTFKDQRTQGHLQPGSPEKLKVKREGNRSWKNGTLWVLPDFNVANDTLLKIDGVVYRITQKTDWSASGFIEYELLETPFVRG